MADAYQPLLRLINQLNGENDSTWGDKADTNWELSEEAIAGYESIDAAGADVTLTSVNGGTDQARKMVLKFTGTLAATREVIVPTSTKIYLCWDATTHSGNTLTIKTSAGSGVALTEGQVQWVFCDGTNVVAGPSTSADVLTTQGDLLTRDASGETRLAVGAANTVLRSDATDPNWGKVAGAYIAMGSDAQGDVLFYNGSAYARLAPGTADQFLQTKGAAQDPVWATAAQLSVAQEFTATQNFNATTLTDAANISWDASANQVASVTLAGNRTLDDPTNMVDGATYVLTVIQDGAGSRTLSYGSAYRWEGGNAPTLSTGAAAVDKLYFVSDGTNMDGVPALDFS